MTRLSVDIASPEDVLVFWFEEIEPRQWFRKDADFDALLDERFGELQQAACKGELWYWRDTPRGRLAEIILLDQMSRNIHRGSPLAFAADPMALTLAQEAVRVAADQQLEVMQRVFLYMPYMHSESLRIHQLAMTLFDQAGMESNLHFEIRHKQIIEQFGRYPHRNEILGRSSTAAELEFLKQPGSSF